MSEPFTAALPPRLTEVVRVRSFTEAALDWFAANTVQIVTALILAGLVATLLLAAKWGGGVLAAHHPDSNHWRRIVGRAASKLRYWFIAAVAAQLVASYAHAPADVARTVNFLFVVTATLQAAIFAREIVLGLVEHRAHAAEHAGLQSAMGIIRLLVTLALFAISAVLILSNLGVNVTGLIAGLGVGGIAIGLAAQGIFADLFAALAILFDRPFRKGDSIRYDGTIGMVEDIGLKSTRLRALTGEQVIVANKQLLEKEIHNLARLARRRIVATLGLKYETDVALLERVPSVLRQIVEAQGADLVRCGLINFGDSTLDFELQYDVHSEDYEVVFETQHRINLAILKRFTALGIGFAYPVQVGYVAKPDGTIVDPVA